MTVTVLQYENNEVLSQVDIGTEQLRDNYFALVDTGELRTKDKKIRIVITGSGFKEDEGIVLYTGENSLDKDAVTKENGIEIEEDLIITTCYTAAEGRIYTWELLLLTAVSFLVFIMQWDGLAQGRRKDEQKETS